MLKFTRGAALNNKQKAVAAQCRIGKTTFNPSEEKKTYLTMSEGGLWDVFFFTYEKGSSRQ